MVQTRVQVLCCACNEFTTLWGWKLQLGILIFIFIFTLTREASSPERYLQWGGGALSIPALIRCLGVLDHAPRPGPLFMRDLSPESNAEAVLPFIIPLGRMESVMEDAARTLFTLLN
jgi:Na+-transporting NADH:ubiquinone oxidoreductase subunit NqrB